MFTVYVSYGTKNGTKLNMLILTLYECFPFSLKDQSRISDKSLNNFPLKVI